MARRALPVRRQQASQELWKREEFSVHTNGSTNGSALWKPNGTANGSVVSNGHISHTKPERPAASATSKASSIVAILLPTFALIFGGCCSNVYTLESLITAYPASGPLITAVQFALVALSTAPAHLSPAAGPRRLFLRERAIPLTKWAVDTAMFLAVNMLNNMAFSYRISIPLHIILRSAGPVTTMAVGYLYTGRRYAPRKMFAVFLLFVGVVLAAVADSHAKSTTSPPPNDHSPAETATLASTLALASETEATRGLHLVSSSASAVSSFADAAGALLDDPDAPLPPLGPWQQLPGFALLFSALLISACMGVYTDRLYTTYGRTAHITSETLFYSHALSLPVFAFQWRSLAADVRALVTRHAPADGSAYEMLARHTPRALLDALPYAVTRPLAHVPAPPAPLVLLAANAATQLLCIVGVNRLAAQSSSLTVSIVLNVRKLVSLVLSIWLFGTTLPVGVVVGAVVVFVGGGLYALPAPAPKPIKPQPQRKAETKRKEL